MKKAVSFMIILMFLISISPFASVSAKSGSNKYRVNVIEIGGREIEVDTDLTDEEISLITPDLLSDIDLDAGPIVSVTQTASSMEDPLSAADGMVSTMSISQSQLLLTVVAQREFYSQTYDYIRFTAIANWSDSSITFLGEDKFAIAWSDDFTLYGDWCTVYYDNDTTVRASRASVTPEVGVGYTINMYNGINASVYKAKIIARTKKYNTTGTANVVAEYAHETFTINPFGSISIGLFPSPNVAFSASWGIIFSEAVPAYDSFSY